MSRSRRWQAVVGYQRYGGTLLAHMDSLGLVGPDFTVAHGVWLDDDDNKLLGDKGGLGLAQSRAATCGWAMGWPTCAACSISKVNVGIGTDGASCSDNQNMYENMRLASMVSKSRGPEWQRWITTDEVLEAATLGSARALGFGDKVGRIAEGYKADIVFLDLHHVNWIPFNDPTNQIVHTEDGCAVHSVMIGGRMVVEKPPAADARHGRAGAQGRGGAGAAVDGQQAIEAALRAAGEDRRHVLPRVWPRRRCTSTASAAASTATRIGTEAACLSSRAIARDPGSAWIPRDRSG